MVGVTCECGTVVYVELDGAKAAGEVDGGTQLSVVVNVPLLLHPHTLV